MHCTYICRQKHVTNSVGSPGAALVYKRPPCRRVANESSGYRTYERRLPLESVTLLPGLIARPPPPHREVEEEEEEEAEEEEERSTSIALITDPFTKLFIRKKTCSNSNKTPGTSSWKVAVQLKTLHTKIQGHGLKLGSGSSMALIGRGLEERREGGKEVAKEGGRELKREWGGARREGWREGQGQERETQRGRKKATLSTFEKFPFFIEHSMVHSSAGRTSLNPKPETLG